MSFTSAIYGEVYVTQVDSRRSCVIAWVNLMVKTFGFWPAGQWFCQFISQLMLQLVNNRPFTISRTQAARIHAKRWIIMDCWSLYMHGLYRSWKLHFPSIFFSVIIPLPVVFLSYLSFIRSLLSHITSLSAKKLHRIK